MKGTKEFNEDFFFSFLMKNLFYILKDVLRRSQLRKIPIKQIACVVNRHVSMYGFDASAL